MKNKISVIIPVYNVEKYLNQCVDSILSQDYDNIEIILVDDGSTDHSGILCDEYAKKYQNILVVHKQNEGAAEARNMGLMKATGDYILFVDSDDFIENNSLKHIVEVVNENPVDLVFLEAQKYFEDGTVTPLGDGITKTMVHKKSRDEVLDFLACRPKYPASPCTKIIKREIITHDVLFERGLFSEDLDWCMKLFLKAETFDYCEFMHYNYRQNRIGSASNTVSTKKITSFVNIIEKWSKIAEEKTYTESNFILSQMAYELPILMRVYGKLKKSERMQFKDRIKKLLFLLEYRRGLKYKVTGLLCKFFGIDFTSFLINVLYRK